MNKSKPRSYYVYRDKDGHTYETDVPLTPEELKQFECKFVEAGTRHDTD
jgi:hypothetical protein